MGSFYQSKEYLKGGGSYYQPKTYLKGGMKDLKINTNKNNSSRTTRLTKSQINSIRSKIQNINANSSRKEQYEQLDSILENISENDFNSDFDKKEIGILKYTIKKILEGKKGSKPSEFISILEKVLDRLTNVKNGGYKKKTAKGGFYPSIMANLLKSGSVLVPLAMRAGYSLFNSTNKTRKNKK